MPILNYTKPFFSAGARPAPDPAYNTPHGPCCRMEGGTHPHSLPSTPSASNLDAQKRFPTHFLDQSYALYKTF